MNETDVIQWVLSQIQTVAGTLRIGDRIFSDKAAKNASNPCLVWQVIGGEQPEITDPGAVTSGTLDIQLRYYAGQRFLANSGRETLRELLSNVEPVVSGTVRIEGTGFTHGGDTFEEKTEDYGALSILAVHWATAASD